MHGGEDRRTHQRHDAVLKVEFASGKAFAQEYTKNISKGGLFIKTTRSFNLQERVLLKLEVPGLKRPVEIHAEVVHVAPQGVGFQFMDVPDNIHQVLDTISQRAQT